MTNFRICPFFAFTGRAEEAMNFYASNLPGAKIVSLTRYGKHPFAAEGEENNVLHGVLVFKGQEIMFMDMTAAHPAPPFSWSASLYIGCEDEAEFDTIFAPLSQSGVVMMGPEAVGDLRKCAWVTDKFGITWQPVWA